MTALLRAELLKLRTTRTFAAVVASAAALSLILVVLGAALGKETKAHAQFTNSAITRSVLRKSVLRKIARTPFAAIPAPRQEGAPADLIMPLRVFPH